MNAEVAAQPPVLEAVIQEGQNSFKSLATSTGPEKSFSPREDLTDVDAGLAVHVIDIGSIAHQPTGARPLGPDIDCGRSISLGKRNDLFVLRIEQCIRTRAKGS